MEIGNNRKKLSDHLSGIPQDLAVACEKKSVSSYSPCPVEDSERLLRALDNPTHWNAQLHEFTPTAFIDAGGHGLSVNREKYAGFCDLVSAAEKRIAARSTSDDARRLVGFADYECGQLRALTGETEKGDHLRLLGIFDTASPNNISHADVIALVANKRLRARARSLLHELGMKALRAKNGNPGLPADLSAGIHAEVVAPAFS